MKRSLIADDVILVDIESVGNPLGIFHSRTLTDRHAFRHARRARCEQHVENIHAIDLPRGSFQQRLVERPCNQFVDSDTIDLKFGAFDGESFVGNHERRLECLKDFLHSRYRHLRVDDCIEIAAVRRPEHAHDRLDALFEQNCNRLMKNSSTDQFGRRTPSFRAQFRKRQCATPVRHREFVGKFYCCLFEIIRDDAFHNLTLRIAGELNSWIAVNTRIIAKML